MDGQRKDHQRPKQDGQKTTKDQKGARMTDVIISINQKGGTGKTTTAAVLAQAAAKDGKRALAIDLDPQANLSYCMRANASGPGSYHLLTGTPAADLIQHIDGVDVIPANRELATLTSGRGTARRLERALMPIKDNYDLITIDTPSTAGELQYNGLQAATGVIISLITDIYDLQALYQIHNTIQGFKASNPALTIKGVIIARYVGNTKFRRQMIDHIKQHAAALDIPFIGIVREAGAVQEAAFMRQSLYEYAPKCKPAQDYLEIYKKITGQED